MTVASASPTRPRVLVTGATGFIGRRLVPALRAQGWWVRRALRQPETAVTADEDVLVGEIGQQTDWRGALAGVELVVHAAARTRQMRESAAEALTECHQVNVLGTKRLAAAAAAADVRRLVFLSTAKVLGETSGPAARP